VTQKWWNATGRVSFTMTALAAIGIALWLYQWHLLSWNAGS